MDYSSQSGTIKNQLSGVNDSVSNINGIDFDSVWSGEVHDQLVTTLNKVINDVNTTKANVEKYTEALELLQQYKEIVEKIEALEAELASIPEFEPGVFDTADAVNTIIKAAIQAQINELTTKKTELYNKVLTALSSCIEISPEEVATVSYTNPGEISSPGNGWTGVKLTARMGLNENGPSGTETWYDLDMSGVVKNMEKLYGYTNLVYEIRDDGVKILSGTTPSGETFNDLVMVAADVEHMSNTDGTFQRGQIVETSLGTGIIVDYCERAENERRYDGNIHFDIATAWHTGEYMEAAYGKDGK